MIARDAYPYSVLVTARAGIGFAGHARSGKSTLARSVAALLGDATTLSFGRAVTQRAQQDGDDTPSRQTLIDTGARWVASDPQGLCRAVLAQADPNAHWLLIDGVRHRAIWTIITKQLTPIPTLLIYVNTPRPELEQRLTADGLSPDAAAHLLRGPTEAQIQELQTLADLTVDGCDPTQHNTAELARLLTQCGYLSDER